MSRFVAVLAVLLTLTGALVVTAPSAAAALSAQESVLARVDGDHLRWYVRRPDGSGWVTRSFVYGLAGDRPLWGDWDGNGTFTAGVVRGNSWLLRNGNGGGDADVSAFSFGRPTDRFLVGDWDGNGTFTPGVVRGTTWFLRNANNAGDHDVQFGYGADGDHPVAGDWDGNGTFTPGVVRGTTWLLRNSNSAGDATVRFGYGASGDRPVAGDWDRNGTWTPGVVRGNTWLLRNSNTAGPADGEFGWGRATDTQLASGVPPVAPAVRPIDWNRFTAPPPADADAARLVSILRNTNRYANITWWSAMGYAQQTGAYLDLGGVAERHVRAPANEAFALAVSLRTGVYDPATAGVSAAEARARAVKLVRSLAFRHLMNSDDGWGGQWQSAMWAAHAGFAGWLLWADLTGADRERVARMVEYEADRFTGYPVPYYRDRSGTIISPGDTKAEENAWNAMGLQVATAMMPTHRRNAAWLGKSVELEISAFSRPADLTDSTVVNGRPVSQWLRGSNVNDDGFVINHGFVHPDYSTTVAENVHAALAHSMAGQPTPRAAFWGADIVYAALVDHQWQAGSSYPPGGAVDPPGGTVYVDGSEHIYYPQGNDWGTDRRIQPTLLDVQARAFGFDSRASQKGDYWQRLHGQRVVDMQLRSADRRTYVGSGEDTYYGREELVAVTAAQAWLTRWILANNAFHLTNQSYTG